MQTLSLIATHVNRVVGWTHMTGIVSVGGRVSSHRGGCQRHPCMTRRTIMYRQRVQARALPGGGEEEDDHVFYYYGDEIGYDVDAVTADWREYRAGLVAEEHLHAGVEIQQSNRWSHQISHPEKGCLLVARRPDLGMFSYSVILITEHDDEIGSSGLVLNMPTPLHIANLGLEMHIAESLGQCPLYIGGPVTRNLLHVLHGNESVEGSMEIIKGVYAGGVESAAELVLQGAVDPSEFRLLAGYSGWEPYQLATEIQNGAWHVISASSDVINGCIKGDYTGFGQFSMSDTKVDCWKAILHETGIPF